MNRLGWIALVSMIAGFFIGGPILKARRQQTTANIILELLAKEYARRRKQVLDWMVILDLEQRANGTNRSFSAMAEITARRMGMLHDEYLPYLSKGAIWREATTNPSDTVRPAETNLIYVPTGYTNMDVRDVVWHGGTVETNYWNGPRLETHGIGDSAGRNR